MSQILQHFFFHLSWALRAMVSSLQMRFEHQARPVYIQNLCGASGMLTCSALLTLKTLQTFQIVPHWTLETPHNGTMRLHIHLECKSDVSDAHMFGVNSTLALEDFGDFG